MRRKQLCGARNRRGTPCQCKALENGRCKFHGGMSTGPKTLEGRFRSLRNLVTYRGLSDGELRELVFGPEDGSA